MNINEIIQFGAGAWLVIRLMLIIGLGCGAFAVWFSLAESVITPKPTQLGGE